jgi:hypothetical protein
MRQIMITVMVLHCRHVSLINIVVVLYCPCAPPNQAPRHEGALGEWGHSSTQSLTSAEDGGEWSASRPE